MFRYQDVQGRPAVFRSLTGMDTTAFEALFADFDAAYQAARSASTGTRRGGQPRRRAPGAGRRHALDLRDRLLMALVWLRAYPTYELLGFFFGLHNGNANRNVAEVLAVLDSLGDFPFDRPDRDPGREPLASVEAVMGAFPEVRLVVDTEEQRVRRPTGGHAAQKPYYSMKKAHTLKTQIAVRPDGRIESVGASVPGGSKHDQTLLKESGVLDRLPPGRGVMADKAYHSLRDEYPSVPIVTPRPARRNHPLTEHEEMANRFIARYRIVVEHAIAQLTRYTVLRQVYRGSRPGHARLVRVVAHLVNRRIEVVPLKTYDAAA